MPASTLTSKGQTTIPRAVRDHLHLQAGDKLDFILRDDGLVLLQPANIDWADLKGALFQPGRRPVSFEDMKKAVRRRQRRKR